jgi:hypothetical protein
VTRAVIHLLNDQPVLVDLVEEPKPGDQSVHCTNVRSLDGKRPVWLDHSDSMFVFPYAGVRFVEIPSGKVRTAEAEAEADEPDELEIDEDFLRRVRDA